MSDLFVSYGTFGGRKVADYVRLLLAVNACGSVEQRIERSTGALPPT